MRATLDAVLAKLEGVRQVGPSSWIALCPGHPDKFPSFRISVGHTRPWVAHCYAGCTHTDVEAALAQRGLQLQRSQRATVATSRSTFAEALALAQERRRRWADFDRSARFDESRTLHRAAAAARASATPTGPSERAWDLLELAAAVELEAFAIEESVNP